MYEKLFHCWKYQYFFVSFSFFYAVKFSLKFFKSRIPKKKVKELVFFNFSGEYYPKERTNTFWQVDKRNLFSEKNDLVILI